MNATARQRSAPALASTCRQLGEVCERIMVGIASAATHAYRPAGVPMIRNTNIKDAHIETEDLLFIDPQYEHQHRNKRLRAGDVVVVRTGNPGIAAVVPRELEGAQCFTSLIIRPNPSDLDSDYLCSFINSRAGQRQFSLGAAGGAQKNVNATTLSRMTIPILPLKQQEGIVAVAHELSGLLRQLDDRKRAFQARKRGLMQQLLTGRKRFPEFSGESWLSKELGEFFEEVSMANRDRSVSLVYSCTKTAGIVPQAERFGRRLASADLGRYKVVEPGDLVYDPMLLWDGSIGFVPAKTGRGVVSPAYETFRVRSGVNREYFWPLLKSYDLIQRYKQISQGTNTRRRKAHAKDFLRLCVLFPPSKAEQDRIAAVLSLAQSEIEQLTRLRELFDTYKRGLLSRLLSGEIKVPA